MESANMRNGSARCRDAEFGVAASEPLLGVDSAELQREGYAVNRQHVRGDAVVHAMGFSVAHHFVEAVLHDVLQALVDFAFAPEEPLSILHPFKVAHGHPSR